MQLLELFLLVFGAWQFWLALATFASVLVVLPVAPMALVGDALAKKRKEALQARIQATIDESTSFMAECRRQNEEGNRFVAEKLAADALAIEARERRKARRAARRAAREEDSSGGSP